MNPRHRIGEISDFVCGAPAEHSDRQFKRGKRISGSPVVLLNPLDPRIDCVRGEIEPVGYLHTTRQCAHMDCVTTVGKLGQQRADRQQMA